jgi:hypothetical protein
MAANTPLPPFRLNFEEAFRFLGRDPRWPSKVGLGLLWSLLSFTIVGALFVQGYFLTLSERVARADPAPLPEWTGYGTLLRKGWRVFIMNLVYNLPSILIGLVIAFLLISVVFSFVSGLLSSGGTRNPTISPLLFSPFLLLLIIPLIAILIPLSFFVSAILPAATAQLVLHDELRAALDLRAVFAFIRRNFGQYALAVGLYLGANLVLGSLSVSYRFTPSGSGGRHFWQEPIFIVLTVVLVVLLLLRVVASFFLDLLRAHLIGQLCWYDRVATGGQAGVL